MELKYKPDWEDAKRRWTAWWNGEVLDRVAICVTAPKFGVTRKGIPAPKNLIDQWTDIDYLLDNAEENMRCTYYGGESVPWFSPNIGPNALSAWLGAELVFVDAITSWAKPIIKDWESFKGLPFDENNYWWQFMIKLIKTATERAKGKYLVGIPDLHAGGDALAALRGTERLCVDIYEYPEKVSECLEFITGFWFKCYEEFYWLTTSNGQEGSISWLGWAPGKTCPLQEDFLALVSPEVSRKFFIPIIKKKSSYLDYPIFHLDGPRSLVHLDLLLDISELKAIQWVPGYGNGPILRWIPLLKKIQSAGKLIHIAVEPWAIEPLLKEISPKGLMLVTYCSSEQEARDLLSWLKNRFC